WPQIQTRRRFRSSPISRLPCVQGDLMSDPAVTAIGVWRRKFTRIVLLAGLVACFVAVTGCGGDDEEASTTPSATAPETEATRTDGIETIRMRTSETEAGTSPETETTPRAETSPESLPGGAGDEEPARVLALFTARGGRITPPVVRVPPFISVKVE